LGRTAIGAAMEYGSNLLLAAPGDAERRVIDISGDGPNNQPPHIEESRGAVLSLGITINGLPIISKDMEQYMSLSAYYDQCVIGGPGAFVVPVEGMQNFERALRMKLVMEIAGTQAPLPTRAKYEAVNCGSYE
jgi:hypothetical protein